MSAPEVLELQRTVDRMVTLVATAETIHGSWYRHSDNGEPVTAAMEVFARMCAAMASGDHVAARHWLGRLDDLFHEAIDARNVARSQAKHNQLVEAGWTPPEPA